MIKEEQPRLILENGVSIPAIFYGTFQMKSQNVLDETVLECLKNGCYGFDTSPSYGTEAMLGNALRHASDIMQLTREDYFVTNKVDGWQMCENNGNVEKYVDTSLKLMGLEYFDLLVIHWPFIKYLQNTWKSMADMLQKEKVRAIGLCNVNLRVYREFAELNQTFKPHVIQNEISPLNADLEEVEFFQSQGVVIQAYSSLCRMIPEISSSEVLKAIASKHGKSIPQIILRWNIERNIIPIFASAKAKRISENMDLFDFCLNQDEIQLINSMDKNYKIFPESFGCPGY